MTEYFTNIYSDLNTNIIIEKKGDDWVKYTNGRVEAIDAAACQRACFDMEQCCYWTWSPIDPHTSCYLKNGIPMSDKTFGMGVPIHSFEVR